MADTVEGLNGLLRLGPGASPLGRLGRLGM